MKSQNKIRNPKSEIRRKSEARGTNAVLARFSHGTLLTPARRVAAGEAMAKPPDERSSAIASGISDFGFLSGFGVSGFGLRPQWSVLVILLLLSVIVPASHAQTRPYIGFAYPAGGQQGTTLQIRLGGQGMDYVHSVLVSGSGVTARVVEYCRRLNNQELQLLNEQLKELKRATSAVASTTGEAPAGLAMDESAQKMAVRIKRKVDDFVQTPACASISTLTIIEVTISPDAEPGRREVRLVTLRGVSNPLAFHVGQFPEFSRKPMLSATLQVLGKESRALRQRPADEVEDRITIPCTVNGQIASGEVNRYRFAAHKGQRLAISTLGRRLVPYIADAVPGWFQPVLTLYDAKGKEVAFADDYRFQPDPVMLFEVPMDGEYVFGITDAIYRGREDFVYRITIGELPFVTSIFPLGAKTGAPVTPRMKGWNLQDAVLAAPAKDAGTGMQSLPAIRKQIVSNPVPFALDDLPDGFDQEPNNAQTNAQKVTLPLIVNGRIDKPDDWDIFHFTGKSNDTVVVEVQARRLDSPLDSVIKLTGQDGALLAFSDDREDLGAGVNTHQADSWFMAKLPADGAYYVHIGDTARQGGEEYGYRLRISSPQPDFELRVVPSSVRIRPNATGVVTVHAQRKDGFTGAIKLELKDPPAGFSAAPIKLAAGQNNTTLTIKGPAPMKEPVSLTVIGSAKIGEKEIAHEAVPADDRMQAFLWRHLVPATDLKVLAWDPTSELPPKRVAPVRPPLMVATNAASAAGSNAVVAVAAAKPKFTKDQIARRLKELQLLYEEDLLTDGFYFEKVAECDTTQ